MKTSGNPYILCDVSDLTVKIPATGDVGSRCWEYIRVDDNLVDIVISEGEYRLERWETLSQNDAIYLESGFQFYRKLLDFNGMMLHSSAVAVDGKAYLFSGPCTVGKSTHTGLWKQIHGEKAIIINDDKPALRRLDDGWFAYGTPWCGKDGINANKKVKLGGICFLKQGKENSIRRLSKIEALRMVMSQTAHKFKDSERLDKKLQLVDQLVREIPIYELTNRPEPEAAILSYETMRKGAEEAGL